MRQIIYVSEASECVTKNTLKDILTVSQSRNEQSNLTGALYLKGRHFIQLLEGPEASLRLTIDRIKNDSRHTNFCITLDRPIEARSFGNWSMILIGNEPEIDRVASWYWPKGRFQPGKLSGMQLFEYLQLICPAPN